jgi:hypothetical protein
LSCALLLALLVPLASGCGVAHISEISFRIDKRLHFIAPKDRAKVKQPVTISWRMDNFTIWHPGDDPNQPNSGYFAIFVDRTPIKPGQTMKAVAAGDRFCQRTAGCPSISYLNNRDVFVTSNTSYSFPVIPPQANDKESVQLHTFIIVLMSPSGHRMKESAWELDLRIPKGGLL